jgi:hypothetical protein
LRDRIRDPVRAALEEAVTPHRILVLGWLVFMLYAYPGHINLAGAEMLIDARYASISDMHSPMMTELWRIVNIVWTGPPSMLFLQSGLLLFGAFVLFKRAMSERAAAICAASLLVFPPVMATMAVISSDAMLAGMLVATAAMFGSARRWVHCVGLFLGFLACGMRDGAWIAAGPIIVFGFTWDKRRLWRYAIAANAWVVATLLAFGLSYVLVDRVTEQNDAVRAVVDIAGTIARTGELSDAEVQTLAPGVRFTPNADLQTHARTSPTKLIAQVKPADVDALITARERVRDHDFGAWVKTRLFQWKELLLHSKGVYINDNVSRDHRFAAAHAARNSPVQKLLAKLARLFQRTPLFWPIVYLILAMLALPFARRYAVFLASGIALELSLVLTEYDIEYRYSTWLIVSTLVALVLIVRARIASVSPGSPS